MAEYIMISMVISDFNPCTVDFDATHFVPMTAVSVDLLQRLEKPRNTRIDTYLINLIADWDYKYFVTKDSILKGKLYKAPYVFIMSGRRDG
jgi:hypothetical protein